MWSGRRIESLLEKKHILPGKCDRFFEIGETLRVFYLFRTEVLAYHRTNLMADTFVCQEADFATRKRLFNLLVEFIHLAEVISNR